MQIFIVSSSLAAMPCHTPAKPLLEGDSRSISEKTLGFRDVGERHGDVAGLIRFPNDPRRFPRGALDFGDELREGHGSRAAQVDDVEPGRAFQSRLDAVEDVVDVSEV